MLTRRVTETNVRPVSLAAQPSVSFVQESQKAATSTLVWTVVQRGDSEPRVASQKSSRWRREVILEVAGFPWDLRPVGRATA